MEGNLCCNIMNNSWKTNQYLGFTDRGWAFKNLLAQYKLALVDFLSRKGAGGLLKHCKYASINEFKVIPGESTLWNESWLKYKTGFASSSTDWKTILLFNQTHFLQSSLSHI